MLGMQIAPRLSLTELVVIWGSREGSCTGLIATDFLVCPGIFFST